jgi:hypothetical protein
MARDFFLFKDIVEVNHTMLIGARSSVQGLFHGPAWLYLNIPAYMLINGNPQHIMWFWLMLYVAFVAAVFIITRKLFNKTSAFLAAALLSTQAAFYINKVTNPYGAVLLFPLFYYFIIQYFRKNNIKNLLISFLILGLLIQFEIAFGLGILLVTLPYLIYRLIKNNKLSHLLSVFILAIPLSTFILFELKHEFLMFHGVLDLLAKTAQNGTILNTVIDRVLHAFVYGFQQFLLSEPYAGYFQFNPRILNVIIGGMILFASFKALRLKKFQYKIEVSFFLLLYFGFWIQTFILNKSIEWYYYWPFVSVVTMMFVMLREYIPKKLFYIVFFLIIANNAYFTVNLLYQNTGETKYWKFQQQLAESVYKDKKKEFGYFINAYDQLSISPTYYAMEYLNKEFPSTKSSPFEKKKITYIIIAPYGDSKPLDNTWWKENKVRITKKPADIMKFKNGFVVERYELTDEELKVNADTTIFNSTDFR